MTEGMLVKHCILVWIFAVFIESNEVTIGNRRGRMFRFRQVTTMQTVSNSDKIGVSRPHISTKSTSAISCAALLMQNGPFTCMEYYDLQSTCRSFHQGETVNSLNLKLNSGWSFYNGEHLGNPDKECKLTAMGTEYRGRTNVTVTGIQCQRWDATSPHNVDDFTLADLITIEGDPGISATNYCRNPDDTPEGPWCYTMDPMVQWDVCDVPMCHCYI